MYVVQILRFLPNFKTFVKDNIHLEKERMILRKRDMEAERKHIYSTQEEKSCDRLMVGK